MKTTLPIVIKPKIENINFRLIEEYYKKQVENQIGVKQTDMKAL